jgi:2-polyprenyl-6-methoxyphenol hydroxylase-like FAD-dependent oxidoreductase
MNFSAGNHLTNLVWYQNTSHFSLHTILADSTGTKHNFSLGVGNISPTIKAAQQESANALLPPNIAALWNQVENPFIQAVTDNLSKRMVFCKGKVLLVGDAVAGLRPHIASGSSQACLHALLLGKVFDGVHTRKEGEEEQWTLEKWEEECLEFSTFAQEMSVKMGNGSQFDVHPMAEEGDPRAVKEDCTLER